jgi:hypothetical protein
MKEQNYLEEDEITLKELILKIKEFFQEVLKNWMLAVLITVPFVLYFFYQAYQTPITYTSELTFMMNDDEGGGLGALGGLAASFGFGGGGGTEFNLEKMLSLLKSRNIIQQGLFEKTEMEGKVDFFANHLIREYNFHKKWEESETLKGFTFKNDKVEEFSRPEYKALKSVYAKVIGSAKTPGILSSNINEDTGIMTLNIESTDEDLSIQLLNSLFKKLSAFYIDKTIEKQKQTYEITKNKADSLLGVMNYVQSRLLKIKDTQRNTILNQYRSEEFKLERDYQISLIAYGEAIKNKEIADFSLKSKTPFIQSIDLPIPPLEPNKTLITYIKQIIIGGILGVFLAIAFIIGRKIYRDTMESN